MLKVKKQCKSGLRETSHLTLSHFLYNRGLFNMQVMDRNCTKALDSESTLQLYNFICGLFLILRVKLITNRHLCTLEVPNCSYWYILLII